MNIRTSKDGESIITFTAHESRILSQAITVVGSLGRHCGDSAVIETCVRCTNDLAAVAKIGAVGAKDAG